MNMFREEKKNPFRALNRRKRDRLEKFYAWSSFWLAMAIFGLIGIMTVAQVRRMHHAPIPVSR